MKRYFIHLYDNIYLDLQKAKRMPIGTVSKGRKKVAEGKWIKVKDNKYVQLQEKPKEDEKIISEKELENKAKEYDNVDDFIESFKPFYGKGITKYFNGKIYGWIGLDSIAALKFAEINYNHRNQKLFYRATNNINENEIKNLKSKNFSTGGYEDGMSVWYSPVYQQEWEGAQPKKAYKYIGVVKGDISGFGSDGEPVLKNVEWVQNPKKYVDKKYKNINKKDVPDKYPWEGLYSSLIGGEGTRRQTVEEYLSNIWENANK